jgi:hypothetical protein
MENLLMTQGKIYKRKIKPIRGAEQVIRETRVETKLPDGTSESVQDAKTGDWIITGSKGERFVFTDKKFKDLYESNPQGEWVPRKRTIIALHNPFGENVRISAPWGTPENPAYQDGSSKAMLISEISPDGNLTTDRYIIGDEEMLLNNYIPE